MQIVRPAATAFKQIGELIGNYRRSGVEKLPLPSGGVLIELSGVETDPILSWCRAHEFAGVEPPQPTLGRIPPRAGAG